MVKLKGNSSDGCWIASRRAQRLHQAFLVRAKYGDSPEVRIVLAMKANPGGHVVLRERAYKVFAKMFSSTVSLDILFLNQELEDMISRVAKPFYRR
jgi:hypothetical protein